VADLSWADTRTLNVHYEPDRICLSVAVSDKRGWERQIIIPGWADSETAKAVINNGILTVTVVEG